MTIMFRSSMRLVLAGVVLVAACVATAPTADAQCSTCATPTVAYYQPTVAYQPTVVAYQKARVGLFDRMRMRRWGVTPVQPVYAAAYAPAQYTAAYTPYQAAYAYTPTSYTAAYAPTSYTTSYAPAVYTAGYRPHVTSYAPLARTTTYYAASQPVVMSPVASACSSCGCEPCGCAQPACPSCSSCSSCGSGVSQAIYEGSSSGCSSCAAASGTPSYSDIPSVGPATPRPELAPDEGAPSGSQFETNRMEIDESPADPAPLPEEDASTYFEAPKLFSPQDRSASRPSVDVRDAVYRRPAVYQGVSQSVDVDTDANGWYAVPGDH